MSGIIDGQPVDAANSNPAWLDANGDDTALGKISFDDQATGASTVSGAAVSNLQKNLNSIASYTGWVLNGVYNLLPTWLKNNRGTTSDTMKQRIEAIDSAFDPTTGHIHDGTAGNGPQVSAATLTMLNYYRGDMGVVTVPSLTGASMDVSVQFVGKTSGGATAAAGVVTTTPSNKVTLRVASSGAELVNVAGDQVYGRLTFSASVWTLTFYVFSGGTETPYTILTTQDTLAYYVEVFTLNTVPTIGAGLGALGSLDATADVVDASPTQRGLVSTITQSFAGIKIFNDLLGLLDTVTNTFYLKLASSSSVALTAIRTLTIDVQNASRSLILAGNLTVSANATVSGTNTGDQTITLTGDVTGSGTGSFAATIAANAVTNAKMATMADQTFKANNSGGTSNPQDVTAANVKTMLGLAGTNSGDVVLSTFGTSPNAFGATISAQVLTLQPADNSNPGGVSIGAQSLAGAKTWNGLATFNAGEVINGASYGTPITDSTTTGADALMTTPTKLIVRGTNASLTSLGTITAPTTDGQFFIWTNLTGGIVTVRNNSTGTAANRIMTGTAADLAVASNASIWLWYDLTSSRWYIVGGSGGGGSSGGSYTSANFTTTSFTPTSGGFQRFRYTGSSAQVLASISGGSLVDGAEIRILGTDNVNTITLSDNDVSGGWLLNGDWTGYQYKSLTLQWDATTSRFSEVSRT